MSNASKHLKIITVDGNGTFDDVIFGADPTVASMARGCRSLVAEIMPGVTEVPWANQKTVGYGVGPKKMSQHFCYLAPHKAHLNIGFFYGADLNDPYGLLEGAGKSLRHVKIRSQDEIRQAALREIIEQASRYLPQM